MIYSMKLPRNGSPTGLRFVDSQSLVQTGNKKHEYYLVRQRRIRFRLKIARSVLSLGELCIESSGKSGELVCLKPRLWFQALRQNSSFLLEFLIISRRENIR